MGGGGGGGKSPEQIAAEKRSSDRTQARASAQNVEQSVQATLRARDASAQARIAQDFTQPMQRAKIYRWTNTAWQEVLACKFNPKTFTIDKANKYAQKTVGNRNVGDTTFSGGQPAIMNVEMFFDTTDTGVNVQQQTSRLLELMMLTGSPTLLDRLADLSDEDKKNDTYKSEWESANKAVDAANAALIAANAPPKVKFVWGRIVSFEAYITKIAQTLTLFLQDGTPVRAKVKVTFQQSRDETVFPPQNPTTRSAARKMWIVTEGETLDWIAFKEYGSPMHWRHIAQTNGIADPRSLRAGQVLRLVPLPKKN